MDGAAPTVFVVDDEVNVRSALARLIRSLGMQVKAFASAREFLGCQRPEGPACLILDVRLAGENGLLVQEALRVAVWHPPIISHRPWDRSPVCAGYEGRGRRFPPEACGRRGAARRHRHGPGAGRAYAG